MKSIYHRLARRVTTCIAISVFLVGCANQEPRVATPLELSETARRALAEAIHLRMLVSACKAVGGVSATHASDVYQSWLDRNWQWVAVADAFYSSELQPQVITYQSQEVALPALKFLEEREIEATHAMNFGTRSQTSRAKTCEKKLVPYTAAEKDLASNPVRKLALETFRQRFGKQSEDIYRVPRLAGNLDPHGKPGRTQYTVEQSLRDKGCTSPRLLTLKNDWPHEAYGAFCSSGKHLFIACEWGKCSVK